MEYLQSGDEDFNLADHHVLEITFDAMQHEKRLTKQHVVDHVNVRLCFLLLDKQKASTLHF